MRRQGKLLARLPNMIQSPVKVMEVESLKKAFPVNNTNYLMGHVYET
jgi:hypothetical protein